MSALPNHKPENPDYMGMRVFQSKMAAGILVTPREMQQAGAPVAPVAPPPPPGQDNNAVLTQEQQRRQQEMTMMAARRKQLGGMGMNAGPTGPGPGMDGFS